MNTNITFVQLENNQFKGVGQCILNNEHYETQPINQQDIVDWKNGKFIQNAMPYLSKDDREFLISGICPKCFDNLFKE